MGSRTLLVLLASAAVTLATPAPTQEAPRRTVLNRVVAVVDDECITTLDLERRRAPNEKALAAWPTPDGEERDGARSKSRRALLDEMIDARLVAKKAAEKGVTVSPADIDAALASIAPIVTSSRALQSRSTRSPRSRSSTPMRRASQGATKAATEARCSPPASTTTCWTPRAIP